MADIDLLPPRGAPRLALVDGMGIATNGSQTVLQLAQRGMQAVCAVDGSGVSADGATVAVLAQRGIRAFCPVDELGVAQSGATADALRRAGIRPMVLLGANGLALTGSATMLTLAQRGLSYFCPVDEAGNATTMGPVVVISNSTIPETATIGTTVGALSVSGGSGTYTYSFLSNPGSLFAISGSNLNTAAALTPGDKPITIRASGGTPSPVDRVFNITVTLVPVAPSGSVSISGSTVVGSVLTAVTGTWAGTAPITFAYQWKRAGTNVGTNSSTYTTVAGDIGSTMTVVVTATNAGGSGGATSAATAAITGIAPANAGGANLPTILGSTPQGSTLTATSGTWTGTPTPTYAYQWKSAGVNVGTGLTTYTTVLGDVGNTMTVVVTATNVAGSANATSSAFGPITAASSGTLAPLLDLTGVCDKGLSSIDNITNVNSPEFDVICLTTPVLGDTITVAKDGVIVVNAVLTAADIAGTTSPSLGSTTLPDGTYTFTARHTNAGSTSAYSAGLSVTIDTVAPVLTSASGAQNGTVPGTVDLSVTTNKGQGIIYWMIQPAAWAAPTPLEIIDYRGTGDGLWVDGGRHGSFNVSSTGAKTASGTVTVSGSFKVFFTHTDTAGNNAAVTEAAWTHTIAAFAANGVGGFDGSTTYMTNTGIVAAGGIPIGKKGLVSFWIKVLGGAGTARTIFTLTTGTTVRLWCTLLASNVIEFKARSSGSIDILAMSTLTTGTPFTPPPTGWIHVAAWWDLSLGNPAGGFIYVNGTVSVAGGKNILVNDIDYSQSTLLIGASQSIGTKFNGALSELYINLHETLDLSDPTNLQKFRGTGGAPMSLGATGTNPTGSQPEFYLGDNNTFADWGTNNGSKGDFTTPVGALTSVTGPP